MACVGEYSPVPVPRGEPRAFLFAMPPARVSFYKVQLDGAAAQEVEDQVKVAAIPININTGLKF